MTYRRPPSGVSFHHLAGVTIGKQRCQGHVLLRRPTPESGHPGRVMFISLSGATAPVNNLTGPDVNASSMVRAQ